MNESQDRKWRILIVDDAPQNLRLLETMLVDQGYQVFALPSGEMALRAAARDNPDLILLDILMPGIDGYEVCTRLKADPQLKHIPVLFLSALNEPWDKIRAFRIGAVDYITKPFQLEEVEARVRCHLELRRQKQELQSSYEKLQNLEGLRDSLVHMVVHDMRAPLTVFLMALDSIDGQMLARDPVLQEIVNLARQSARQLTQMANNLLDISRLEASEMPLQRSRGDLVALARTVVESSRTFSEGRQVRLEADGPLWAAYDADLIQRVLHNMVGNALKFTPKEGEVIVQMERADRHVRVAVIDNGPGIPPSFQEKIFEKFSQVETRQKRSGTGLGLAFCKLAVEAHGGEVAVRSEVGRGSTFWFTLPLP